VKSYVTHFNIGMPSETQTGSH